MKKSSRGQRIFTITVVLIGLLTTGCSRGYAKEKTQDDMRAENIIITETGEVMEKPTPQAAATEEPTPTPEQGNAVQEPAISGSQNGQQAQAAATPAVDVDIPVQEQVITEEDQTEPQGYNLQLVFLGDSIFDNNRDGTGVPYLTAKQCEADVYNLAIGGTSASIEEGEVSDIEKWTSRGLCGVANAMGKRIPTDIFQGTRTGELLDNPHIDFSQTDYFIVEYGTNDFFRGVRQSDSDAYNLHTYGGALRYSVSRLREVAPDATIIFCSPMHAQFYKDGYLVGDGNTTNNGQGTLFDYAGTCNYVANEQGALFFNAYLDLGITGYTAEEYLEDGVHLTDAGRQLYADALAKIILNYEETKNN